MRAIIFLLIIAVLVVIAGVATGFVDISHIRGGEPPKLSTTPNGIRAKAGQPPAFDVETGSVKVGTTEATVKVPTLQIQKPGNAEANASTNNAM